MKILNDTDFASNKLLNLPSPATANEAATKGYVDGVAQGGVYWKSPVRVLRDTNITISNPATSTIDGVTLANGDRVALIAQTTGSQNGIYVFNGSAVAMTRATDSDTSGEMPSGVAFFVDEGTNYGNSAWVLTTDDPITLGTTALVFVQFSGLGQIVAGNGLTKTGNTLAVGGNAGRIVVNADDVDLASGIVSAGTYKSVTVDTYGRVTAGTNPATVAKYSATIGDGSTLSFAIAQGTHGLASNGQMMAAAYDASTGALIVCDISINNANGTVTFAFAVAPASNAIRIVIMG